MFKNTNICRTCGEEKLELHELITTTEHQLLISEILEMIVPQVFNDSVSNLPLPQQVCTTCFVDLKMCYNFIKRCLHVHAQFKMNAVNTKTCVELDEIIECHQGTKKLKEVSNDSENEDPLDVVNNDSDLENTNSQTACTDDSSSLKGVGNVKWLGDMQSNDSESSNDSFEVKLTSKTKKTLNSCPECHKTFRRKYLLKDHERVHLLSNTYVCNICGYRFETAAQLNGHETEHKSRGSFKCTDCGHIFQKKAFLASHCRLKHNEAKKFTCQICLLTFKSSLNYNKHKANKHMLEEKEEDIFAKQEQASHHRCHVCNKTFASSMRLKEHVYTHTGERPLKCSQCFKTFRGKSALRQHMLRHQSKTVECLDCALKFYQISELKKHQVTHSTAKPYECDVCQTRFSRSDSLKEHKRIHDSTRPFKCQKCSKTFLRKKFLEAHLLTHAGIRPYKCKYCERVYTAQSDLNKHLKFHLGDNIYNCSECSKTFKYKIELRQHCSEHFKAKTIQQTSISTHEDQSNMSAQLEPMEEILFSE